MCVCLSKQRVPSVYATYKYVCVLCVFVYMCASVFTSVSASASVSVSASLHRNLRVYLSGCGGCLESYDA